MSPKEKEPKLDRRVVRSRAALKESLLALMALKPFASISITEIVEHANYNRGTFYANYESKEALLDDMIADLIEKLLQSYRAPYEKVEVFHINELPASSVMLFKHFHDHASVYTVLMKSDVLPHLRERMFMALKNISMKELSYPNRGIDEELMATFSIHALLGLVFHWVESGFKHSPEYMQQELVKIINWRPTTVKPNLPPSDKG
ncbi:AcrR family transcriptional regulator [Paenibacillus phyllosphaerae]|uniref:AcrR family transcriptional regulator n=1 Tax=Paenibacillus phyllosphaerae TaxID=274593 RepID=A0A7W5B337_9BACL|nr:TetR/AcrR family transcriptional regulator [Paenibacillus phyllosphaerae]MBB3113289.1 AcrR family transcriptional regulator [Paenibacillus phyllosphaerae]